MADIKSEARPASTRNWWPASCWNAWPASSESAIKRGDEISSAYWVQESLQWRRLVIYHESAKTVEDTVRAVLGSRGGDYAEDDWDEESVGQTGPC